MLFMSNSSRAPRSDASRAARARPSRQARRRLKSTRSSKSTFIRPGAGTDAVGNAAALAMTLLSISTGTAGPRRLSATRQSHSTASHIPRARNGLRARSGVDRLFSDTTIGRRHVKRREARMHYVGKVQDQPFEAPAELAGHHSGLTRAR